MGSDYGTCVTHHQCDCLRKKMERLEAALRFYADAENWARKIPGHLPAAADDQGRLAKEALRGAGPDDAERYRDALEQIACYSCGDYTQAWRGMTEIAQEALRG